jgi:glycosyltransferase involved in cell wall biosynthesis
MKLLHIYDHTYYQKDGNYYSSGAFGKRTWEMYLGYFDQITVLSNLYSKSNADIDFSKLDISSTGNVDFKFIKNYRLPNNYLKGFFKRDELLKTEIAKHDAVVIRLPSELGLFAVEEAKKQNKPYAIEVVGCAWDSYWYHGSLQGAVMAPITFKRMKDALREAPFAIYVTEHFLQQRYPTKGFGHYASDVIIPPVDEGVLQKRLEKIKNGTGKVRIGLAGTLNVKYKGHREALNALKTIQSEIPDFELLFIGKGDPAWVNSVISNLKMEGHARVLGKITSGDEMFNFFDNLDLYLHPSKHEGLPRVVIEAMSRACPILASSIAGIPQLLPGEVLHKPGDHKTLGDHIKAVLND